MPTSPTVDLGTGVVSGLDQGGVMKNLAAAGYPVAPSTTPAAPAPGAAPAPTSTNTMPATAFSSAATTPLSTPAPAPAVAPTGLTALTSTFAVGAQKSLADQIASLQADQANQKSSITDLITKIGGASADKLSQYDTKDPATGLSINDLKKETDSLTSQMEMGNKNASHQITAIQEANANGMYGPGAQGEIDRINRQNASYQADLAISLAAKTRQFSTAKNIIDAKVDAETEAEKAKLDALKTFYSDNSSKLSTAQQNSYQLQIKDAQNQYDTAVALKKNIGDVQLEAAKNGASADVIQAIGKAQSYEDAVKAAGPALGSSLDNIYKKLQIAQLQRQLGGGDRGSTIVSYAQQYASTGTIPSTDSMKADGIRFSDVASAAKDLPKPDGTVVDKNTGVKPASLSAAQQDGITSLYDLTKKLDQAQALFDDYNHGFLSGVKNAILPSQAAQRYNDLRSEIVDLLARARTGATLNAQEEKTYASKLPSNWNKTAFLGSSGDQLIQDLKSSINGKLQTTLNSAGVSIYGFSTIKGADGKDYTVGQLVQNGQGQTGRVNPDGSITLITQ